MNVFPEEQVIKLLKVLNIFLSLEVGINAFTERQIVVWNVFRHNICKISNISD